ncbi:MAG: hypothetical protein KGM49_10165 [Sphingomonadales bacterium]|nr:hypothetical protein [Sphingomonadales bacterium]
MAARRKVRVLRLSWPVQDETHAALLGGDAAALDRDPWFARLLKLLRADNPLGDFGIYRAVAEVTPCWELFSPSPKASPTRGEPGQSQVSTNLMVTIHLPGQTPEDEVDALLDALVAQHPWEIPVIELAEVELLVRDA